MKKNSHYCWMMILGLFPAFSYSLPVIEEVMSGEVAISSPDSSSLLLHTSDFSIIQYQAFSINKGERVHFVQPSSSSVVLNRVSGKEPSSIFGSLSSNGKVLLVNPNGVYFGKEAQVNVGSLIASTLDITNQDFLEDRALFKKTETSGSIVNEGFIEAKEDVVFLGSQVVNKGEIVALVGKVMMAAGEKIILNFTEDKMIGFSMEGMDSSAEIVNEGICRASEGEVILSVNAARKIIDAVVNADEIAQGDSIVEEGGKIFLKGGSSLRAKNITLSGGKGSSLSAEGHLKADKKLLITFDTVFLDSSFLQAPSGEISINALYLAMNASSTFIGSDEGATSGGLISLHAQDTLILEGTFTSAGGIVKTYSDHILQLGSLSIDTSDAQGKMGTWFLNPSSLEGLDSGRISSHVHITLAGDGVITSPITLEQKGMNLTLETALPDAFLFLGAHLSTNEGAILVKSPLQLLGAEPIEISSHGADITFKEVIEGSLLSADLLLSAGKEGRISFEKSLGVEHPLAKIEVIEAENVFLSNNVSTKGKSVILNAPLQLKGDCKIDTTAGGIKVEGADIYLLEGITGNHRLNLDAGLYGAITAKEGIGAKGAVLSALSMKGSAIHLQGDVKADGGTLVYNGPVYLLGDMTMTDTGPTGIIFLDTLNSVGLAHSLTLSAPIGKVLFVGEVGGIGSFRDVNISSHRLEMKSNINLEGSLIVTAPTYLLGDVIIRAANIEFGKTVEGVHNLILDAGSSGSILFYNHIGKKNRIGQFRIINAKDVTTQSIFASSIIQEAGSGLTTFNGVLDTVYQEGVELTGVDFQVGGGVNTKNGGSFSVYQSGTLEILQAMDLSGGFLQSGSGVTQLSADITSRGQDITFTGALTLQGPSSLNTLEEGSGSISFLGQMDSVLESPYSLSLTLGGGDLLFAEAVGSDAPLGDIVIYSAKNVTAQEDIFSLSYTQVQGSGVGSYLGDITCTGELGIYIFSHELVFAGQSAGQLLTTLGKGNMMLNSIYSGLGSEDNPIALSIGLGLGTVYEGAFGTVYFASDINEVASICTVRSNPGCQVLYAEGGADYLDVTPDRCCYHISPTPPPPPPGPPPSPPPSPSKEEARLYYIPGIYTNYWFFKDTLGSAWYFTSDFATRWWDLMDFPCKPSIEGIFGFDDEDCLYEELTVEARDETNPIVVKQDLPLSKNIHVPATDLPSQFLHKLLLTLGLLSSGVIIFIAAIEEYRRVFNHKKRKRRIMKLWNQKKVAYVSYLHQSMTAFKKKYSFRKAKKQTLSCLKDLREACFLGANRASQYFRKAPSKEQYFFDERVDTPAKKKTKVFTSLQLLGEKAFTRIKELSSKFVKKVPVEKEPNFMAKMAKFFSFTKAAHKAEIVLEEKPVKEDLFIKMKRLFTSSKKTPAKGEVFVEKVKETTVEKTPSLEKENKE